MNERSIYRWIGCCLGALMVLSALGVPAEGRSYEHYPLGVEGIKAATLPPPGHYFRNYFLYYTTGQMKDKDGNDAGVGLDADIFAWAPRWIWITDVKVLGANYGMDVLLPLFHISNEMSTPGISDDKTCIGDIYVEPLVLSWHGQQWDAAVGAAFWAPTGHFDANEIASPGRGFWSAMFTYGGTVYLDADKTWSVSALGRYEIHTEQEDTGVTPGNDMHLEWGVGKTIVKGWDAGVAGYCHWQTTDDHDVNGLYDDSEHDRVYGIGPEVVGMLNKVPLLERPAFLSVRALWEFGAVDRSEGFRTVITFTVPF